PAADPFTVERVTAGTRLVRSPDKLFGELERREFMPVRVKDGGQAFAPLPKSARARFPEGSATRVKAHGPQPPLTRTQPDAGATGVSGSRVTGQTPRPASGGAVSGGDRPPEPDPDLLQTV